jgi:hypothetical protein
MYTHLGPRLVNNTMIFQPGMTIATLSHKYVVELMSSDARYRVRNSTHVHCGYAPGKNSVNIVPPRIG